jgi:FkbM family methyltransferase
MYQTIIKIVLKLSRVLKLNAIFKIRSGIMKSVKWHSSIPDSRYIIGNYESNLANTRQSEVIQGKRFIDIGANAGYFSLLASRYGEPFKIHIAIEPMPGNIDLLKNHLEINDINNVIIEQIAISDKEGVIEFSNSDNLAANTYKKESTMFNNKTITVKTIDLNTFAIQNKLDDNCFIKIDVEGAELDVLKGGLTYLKTFKPKLLLATHDCHVKNVKKDCLDILESIGYKYVVLDDIKIDGQEDFLCIPV